jgi:hypothetical protein
MTPITSIGKRKNHAISVLAFQILSKKRQYLCFLLKKARGCKKKENVTILDRQQLKSFLKMLSK